MQSIIKGITDSNYDNDNMGDVTMCSEQKTGKYNP